MLQVNGSTPYYQQIKQYIRKLIQEEGLQPHEQIPSERELCEQFSLSRTTIRLALAEAEKEGLVYRVHGKGTFVSLPKIDQGLSAINSFEDTMRSRGLKPRIEVLSVEALPADLVINTILQLGLDEELMKLTLLGYANEEPIVHYESYLSRRIGRTVADEALQRAAAGLSYSTFELYTDRLGIKPVVTNQTFEATLADQETARLLQIQEGAAVFLITSLVYAENQQPIEYKAAHYRGDKFKFNVSRKHL
ncbi:GntR bacterial regulatory protein HTH signature [Acididesulfobacillus acetoxydans]|uniref:GntR bacterial regulatory protein HTH signature n=1 Tax=Acididesulfobacillus acetoxydans TaxID=1561005 RepID=A0A8S0X211_9FIRM|nr:GntR family transcriptional regulator [Acididesulfobacillus acetoxydans]CAA7603371.1 GntR bacterial regulatory protein HTH signature [Acididesulfobacillus acetoxydans]CEJ09300.1 HTH-type transcriptional repressor YvoA [Acididesulfobacillus acetoxydans]